MKNSSNTNIPFFEIKLESFLKKCIHGFDGRLLPVSTIYCVGQNYVKHIEELKSINIGKPLIFSKPPFAIIEEGEDIIYPEFSELIHHEVEIAIYICKECKNIDEKEVSKIIGGYAIALDLTCRDLQTEAKKNGGPWLISKGFDTSCPITPIYPFKNLEDLLKKPFYLKKNGNIVQKSDASFMIFNIPKLVSFISKHFTLTVGDIILTGTCEGVGPINKNDILSFGSDDIKEVSFKVV
ncbi:MAG: fumarylacetoacetate hydrolase family protein [Spirochaetales bacterium]|nr:fumarylacetoacetate hydrolase family protein [Spirochaetales bacterium]